MAGLGGVIGGILGTAIGGPAGGMIGSALGGSIGGNDSSGSSAAGTAAAANAPAQTPLQQALSTKAQPYLEGWLTKPPKMYSQPQQMTKVNVGGDFSYTPSSTQQVSGITPSNTGSGNATGQTGTRYPVSGSPAAAPTNIKANATSDVVTQAQAGQLNGMGNEGAIPSTQQYYNPTQVNPAPSAYKLGGGLDGGSTANPVPLAAPYQATDGTWRQQVRVGGNGNTYDRTIEVMAPRTQSGGIPAPGGNSANLGGDGDQAILAGGAPKTGATTQPDYGFPSAGQQFNITPGQVTIPNAPVSTMTYGQQGNFQSTPDRFSRTPTSTADVFGGLQTATPDVLSGLTQSIGNAYANVPSSVPDAYGSVPTSTADVYGKLPTKTADVYGNLPAQTADVFSALPTRTANVFGNLPTATKDVYGNLQTGYDQNYINSLANSKLNPLTEAYNNALNKADADANRTGMVGSGFNKATKFGANPGSVTRDYLDRSAQVAQQVQLAGAEAQRADAYNKAQLMQGANVTNAGLAQQKAADLQNYSLANAGLANTRAGQMQSANLANAALAKQKADALQSANLANAGLETNRANALQSANLANAGLQQQKATDVQNANLANVGLAQQNAADTQGANLTNAQLASSRAAQIQAANLANAELASQKAQLQQGANVENANLATQQAKNLSTQDQTNEANRQWWANTLNAQQQYDNTAKTRDWNNTLGLAEYLTGREDTNMARNQGLDLQLQSQNNDYQQQTMSNIMSAITGQNSTAALANKNYWSGVQQNNTDQTNANTANSNIMSAISAAYNKANTPVTAPATNNTTNLVGANYNPTGYVANPIDLFNQQYPTDFSNVPAYSAGNW